MAGQAKLKAIIRCANRSHELLARYSGLLPCAAFGILTRRVLFLEVRACRYAQNTLPEYEALP
jgi:hypothetical protein